MGSFANSVFSVLLGWIRTAVNEFWTWTAAGGGFGRGALACWPGLVKTGRR